MLFGKFFFAIVFQGKVLKNDVSRWQFFQNGGPYFQV
jgi:hypothetical protein